MSTTLTSPFILAINGSPHENKNTASILKIAVDAARKAGAHVQVEHLPSTIPHSDGERLDEMYPDLHERLAHLPETGGVRRLICTMLHADGIIFATPTHSLGPSTRLKALIDWMMVSVENPDFPIENMPVAAMTSFQEVGSEAALSGILMPVRFMRCVNIKYGGFCRQERGSEHSEGNWQNRDHVLLGYEMVDFIRKNPRLQRSQPLAAD